MVSIVIAAHNEAAALGTTLDAITAGTAAPLDVVVVVNGSTDATADVARSRGGVTVLELAEPGKPQALNAGDRVAVGFPRVYLDADIAVPAGGVDAVVGALSAGALAAVPARRLVTAGRPWPVRAYFAINERLPAFEQGVFGRGMIALSEQGRSRFGEFPAMVADDLFLDSLYAPGEIAHVNDVEVVVETPHTTRELVRRLTRVRRGNAAMRQAGRTGVVPTGVRPADRWSWLRDVVLVRPTLAPAGVAYVLISVLAAVRARRGPVTAMAWGRGQTARR